MAEGVKQGDLASTKADHSDPKLPGWLAP